MSDAPSNDTLNKTMVTLDICDQEPKGHGWIPVDSSTDTTYHYKFTGGNHVRKNGNIVHKIDSVTKTVQIQLDPAIEKRYEFVATGFIFDEDNQLSCGGAKGKTATFQNKCVKEMDAHYGVRVRDLKTGDTLLCDPAIRNKPV